jgi:hypothetical protein
VQLVSVDVDTGLYAAQFASHDHAVGLVQLWALLILDPNERTQALRESLQSGRGWQRKLKRGTHTLRWAHAQQSRSKQGFGTTPK